MVVRSWVWFRESAANGGLGPRMLNKKEAQEHGSFWSKVSGSDPVCLSLSLSLSLSQVGHTKQNLPAIPIGNYLNR